MPIHESYASFLKPSQIEGPLLELARELLYCDIDSFVEDLGPLGLTHKTEQVGEVHKSLLLRNMNVLAQMSQEWSCPTLEEYVNQHFPNSVYGVYAEMVKLFKTRTRVLYGEPNFVDYTVIGDFLEEDSPYFQDESISLKGESWEIIGFSKNQFDLFKTKIESPYSSWKIKKITNVEATLHIPYLGRIFTSELWIEPSEDTDHLNRIKFIFHEGSKKDLYLRMTYNKIKGIEKCK